MNRVLINELQVGDYFKFNATKTAKVWKLHHLEYRETTNSYWYFCKQLKSTHTRILNDDHKVIPCRLTFMQWIKYMIVA